MAAKTYKAQGIVLKKTKLGEKDLIITVLDQDGSLVQCVAKGARKPGGSFASRLELFSVVDVMLAKGRSLDVVCEARLVDAMTISGFDLERTACASPIAELLCAIAQQDLEQPRLFDMARSAFLHLADASYSAPALLAIASAALWKIMAQSGFRPSFSRCAICSKPVDLTAESQSVALSMSEGGTACGNCLRPADAVLCDANIVRWCEALISLRFDDVAVSGMDVDTAFATLRLVRQWVRVHTGRTLKSLDFLFVSGLF